MLHSTRWQQARSSRSRTGRCSSRCPLRGLSCGQILCLPALHCNRAHAGIAAQEVAKDILDNQTPKQLLMVRGKLYELLVNCLPPEIILRKLSLELMQNLDDQMKHQCAVNAAFYEHRLQVKIFCCCHLSCMQGFESWLSTFRHPAEATAVQSGSKAIMHLEAFVARFMSEYKQFLVSAFS